MFSYENLEVYKKAYQANQKVYRLVKENKNIAPYARNQLGRASLNWVRQKKKNNQREKEFAYINDVNENPITNQIVEAEIFREIFLT